MVLDHLLDLALNLRSDLALRDLLQKGTLSGSEVSTELALPPSDLVNGDSVELSARVLVRVYGVALRFTHKTVDTSVDDRDLNLHGQGLVLSLLCKWVSLGY